MVLLNTLLDKIFYGLIEPLFGLMGQGLSIVLIKPFVALGVPLPLHVALLAVLLALYAFWLRARLRVDEKVAVFNLAFAAKREQQKDLQLISNKYSRSGLKKATDDELNDDFNTYLAHHYGRYVLIYLLPIFLTMAWLNTIFSDIFLIERVGIPYVLPVPDNNYGVQGLSVTCVFLVSYIIALTSGFQIKKKWQKKTEKAS
ncbi:MAG: hypothetical protein PF442_11795 [Desulfobulbaceae bacterium]|jgi:hypothetical protein|nr:hypothetical protein [Desulfobulbaceae bacterium]